jgi:hypothetical protein
VGPGQRADDRLDLIDVRRCRANRSDSRWDPLPDHRGQHAEQRFLPWIAQPAVAGADTRSASQTGDIQSDESNASFCICPVCEPVVTLCRTVANPGRDRNREIRWSPAAGCGSWSRSRLVRAGRHASPHALDAERWIIRADCPAVPARDDGLRGQDNGTAASRPASDAPFQILPPPAVSVLSPGRAKAGRLGQARSSPGARPVNAGRRSVSTSYRTMGVCLRSRYPPRTTEASPGPLPDAAHRKPGTRFGSRNCRVGQATKAAGRSRSPSARSM